MACGVTRDTPRSGPLPSPAVGGCARSRSFVACASRPCSSGARADATESHGQDARATSHTPSERPPCSAHHGTSLTLPCLTREHTHKGGSGERRVVPFSSLGVSASDLSVPFERKISGRPCVGGNPGRAAHQRRKKILTQRTPPEAVRLCPVLPESSGHVCSYPQTDRRIRRRGSLCVERPHHSRTLNRLFSSSSLQYQSRDGQKQRCICPREPLAE